MNFATWDCFSTKESVPTVLSTYPCISCCLGVKFKIVFQLVLLLYPIDKQMMTSSIGNIFRVTGLLCGKFNGDRWIPRTKGQWHRALMFSLIWAWINGWVNNCEAGDLRRHRAHYGITHSNDNTVNQVRTTTMYITFVCGSKQGIECGCGLSAMNYDKPSRQNLFHLD